MNWQSLFSQRTRLMRRSAVREILKALAQPGMISFAGGIPAPELFPVEAVASAAARVLEQRGALALQYGETEGLSELRDWIADRYSRPHYRVRRENVMIVTGSQQALDLLGKIFLEPRDPVLVENPTYLALLSAWAPWQPEFVPVGSDADGMSTSSVPTLLQRGAKAVYVVPNFQNPQGTTLSLPRRRELLAALTGQQTVLVEDNPYGELRYEGEALPDLLALDARSSPGGALQTRVIHLGTFSKTLAPGLRVGWVLAEAEVIDKLVQSKQAADLHTSTLCQYIVLELLRQGVFERQLPRLREAYRVRRDAMLEALAAHFPPGATWTRPAGGMFLLVTLPRRIETRLLLQQALDQNVAFVPGDDFHQNGAGRNTLRLNFSHASPEDIETGIKRLGRLLAGQEECDHELESLKVAAQRAH